MKTDYLFKLFCLHIFILILVIGLCGCNADSSEQKPITSVADLQKTAMQKYMKDPIAALPDMTALAKNYSESGDHKQASGTFLNIASIYDESKNQKDSALIYAEKALESADKTKDSKKQANLLKYVGYLKGQTGQTKEGKMDLVQAVMKFKSQKDHKGVALSHFNLARVFYLEGGMDESEHFLSKSTNFWRNEKDDNKVFYNNLFAISLFQSMGSDSKVMNAVEENQKLKKSIDYDGYIKDEFERLLAELAAKKKK